VGGFDLITGSGEVGVSDMGAVFERGVDLFSDWVGKEWGVVFGVIGVGVT
jgi:hypothetical protein